MKDNPDALNQTYDPATDVSGAATFIRVLSEEAKTVYNNNRSTI